MADNLPLPSLDIKGFRALRKFKIDHLGRVNLIVGANNTGKSSVLEAVRLWADRGSLVTIRRILEFRDESKMPDSETTSFERESKRVSVISHLFSGYPSLHDDFFPISVGQVGEERNLLSLGLEWAFEEPDEEGNASLKLFTAESIAPRENLFPILSISYNKRIRMIRLDFISKRNPYFLREEKTDVVPCVLSTPYEVENNSSVLWDNIQLTEEENDVIRALQIVSPEIQRISLLGKLDHPRQKRVALVKLEGMDRPIPLHSLGDGVSKLFDISLAMVNAKDGLLLIDEVENGIHYSIQPELWRFIFTLAKRLNIQVFATSHSWDCVEAFQQAASENEAEEGVLVRLNRVEDDIYSTIFTEDELAIATKEQIEVR